MAMHLGPSSEPSKSNEWKLSKYDLSGCSWKELEIFDENVTWRERWIPVFLDRNRHVAFVWDIVVKSEGDTTC
jgi:hypothetical protein